jgi:hypothetical protein
MNRFERWLDRVYAPNPQPWKRRVLFWISSITLIIVAIAGVAQFRFAFAPGEFWLLLALFGVLGIAGLHTSIFGSDFWVAVMLGRI